MFNHFRHISLTSLSSNISVLSVQFYASTNFFISSPLGMMDAHYGQLFHLYSFGLEAQLAENISSNISFAVQNPGTVCEIDIQIIRLLLD